MVLGLDFETHLMEGDVLAPKPVSLGACRSDGEPYLLPCWELETWERLMEVFEGDEPLLFQAGWFDLTVIVAHKPEFFPIVFRRLLDGTIHDTSVRERLIHLGTHGHLDKQRLQDGTFKKLSFSQAAMELHYLGIDRFEEKQGEDAWRKNYNVLDGVPIEQWPVDARRYALDDPRYMVQIFHKQEEAAKRLNFEVFKTEGLRVALGFALRLQTCYGWRIDLEEKRKVEAIVEEALKPENLQALIEEGIYFPPEPPRPYANGAKNPDGTPKMTQSKKQRIGETKLRELVTWVCKDAGIEPEMTDPSPTFPDGQVSLKDEWIQEIAHLHPTLAEFHEYKKLQKLFTTELPRMGDGTRRVHPFYDVLKETGRTSSFSDKNLLNQRTPVFSANIQNIDPRARNCYVADPGWVLCSSDYSGLELATQAQMQLDIFGKSRLGDLINAGSDAHSYLAAQLAYLWDESFRRVCDDRKFKTKEEHYELLLRFKDNPELKDFFEKYRKLAKVFGLGKPGGLGNATMVTFAKSTYGVEITEEQAHQGGEVWKQTFPECSLNFQYIEQQLANQVPANTFTYETPMGMRRANTTFCAAANGVFLQSPAAEGGAIAVIQLARHCYDPTLESILLGCIPLAWIHDEAIVMIPDDDLRHERALEVSKVMVDAMSMIIRDIRIKAEPVLMRKWDKRAEPVFDDNGNLTIWEPAT